MSDPRHSGLVWELICELKRLANLFDSRGDNSEHHTANAYWHAAANCEDSHQKYKDIYYKQCRKTNEQAST